MNIALLTHYYPPEIGAPQARLSEMAKTWRQEGHTVTVLTCFPNHPDGIIPEKYRDMKYFEEEVSGIKVCRTWVYATPNKGFLRKILGHISFMFSSLILGGKVFRGQDVIIVSSPTFFSVISAWVLSRRYRIPYVFEVRDLWPAIFIELGVLKNKVVIHVLEKIELLLYKKSAAVVSVTHSFSDNIIKRGIPQNKVFTITNGVDLDSYVPQEKNSRILNKYGFGNKFIVMYMGAHGISHALGKIVDAAEKLSKIEDILFLFIGDGAEKNSLVAKAKQINLKNIFFLPSQQKSLVPELYSVMDVGLVPLRDIPLFSTFIPSKMFEIMAMGKPIVASVTGEAAEILEKSKAALISPPEEVGQIVKHILTLYNDKKLRQQMGENGRKFVQANYDRRSLALKYLEIVRSCL